MALSSLGAEIESAVPSRDARWLRVAIEARGLLDPRTRSTIESGLQGSCLYHVELLDARDRVVLRRVLQLTLRYDVWEQRYELEGPRGRLQFASLAAAESTLARPGAVELVPLQELRESAYRLRVEVDVRPIAPADRRRLSQFLSQSGGGQEELHIDIGALFGRMARGGPTARPFTSQLFRPDSLEAP